MSLRYRVLTALWLFQAVNYVERVALAFAGPTITASLGLSPQGFGLILSSFAVGYVIGQIPGGLLADRYGAKIVLVVCPMLWAAFTGCLGLVTGLTGFIVARSLFGLSEGMSNAAIFKTIGDLFAPRERSRASGLWTTSTAIAPAFAGPLVGMLLAILSWRWVFGLLMFPALLIALLNGLCIPGRDSEALTKGPGNAGSVDGHRTSLARLLLQRDLWILSVAYIAYNIGLWGFIGWMPSYLAAAHHIDIKELGLLGGVPYVLGVAGLLAAGWLGSGRLYRFQPCMMAVCYLAGGGFLLLAFRSDTLPLSLAGLSGTAFCLYGSLSLFGPVMLELAPPDARAAFGGTVTSIGQLGGVVAPAVIGWLVTRSGGYGEAFAFMIGALGAAAACILLLAPRFATNGRPLDKRHTMPGDIVFDGGRSA